MIVLLIIAAAFAVPIGGLYILDHSNDYNSIWGRLFLKMKTTMNSGVRGYIGLVGTAMTAIGMFLPCAKAWFVVMSFYDGLSETSMLLCGGYFLLLALAACCFASRKGSLGSTCGILLLIMTLWLIFGDSDGMSISETLGYIQYGFWVITIGEVLMSLSTVMAGANAQIEKLFLAPQSRGDQL